METCFILTGPVLTRRLFAPQLPSCNRRRNCPTSPKRPAPIRMAKYEPKKTTSERPEEDRPLEKILPPQALPTLTTLTGETTFINVDDSDDPDNVDATESLDDQILQMGPGMSAMQENALLGFFAGVSAEFKQVEWPSFRRVIRLTIIVIITILVATSMLYVVDGFFYRVAQTLFENQG